MAIALATLTDPKRDDASESASLWPLGSSDSLERVFVPIHDVCQERGGPGHWSIVSAHCNSVPGEVEGRHSRIQRRDRRSVDDLHPAVAGGVVGRVPAVAAQKNGADVYSKYAARSSLSVRIASPMKPAILRAPFSWKWVPSMVPVLFLKKVSAAAVVGFGQIALR